MSNCLIMFFCVCVLLVIRSTVVKAGPGYFLGINCLIGRAAQPVRYLPEATTVLAHRVFSMLRLSLTGGSPSSCSSLDDKYTE